MSQRKGQVTRFRATARFWYDRRATCRAEAIPVEDFYPPGNSDAPDHVLAACARCPVRSGCLEAAMAEEGKGAGRYGIRGGLTPDERRGLLRDARTARQNEARKTERAARKDQGKAA